MRKVLLSTFAVALIVTTAPASASAWVVPEPAPDTPPGLVETVDAMRIMQPTPTEWAPRGELVADSGFRPARDGLGMLNWPNTLEGPSSLPIQINHYYLGYPLRTPIDLQDRDVRTVLGRKQACVPGVSGCQLTTNARLWQEGTNAGMAGGHCFGIAATVAQIFNGMISKQAIGATSTPYKAAWNSTLMRQVARAWSTQKIVDLDKYTRKPSEVVKLLKANLRPGYAPYVAGIYSTTGDGHGVTPVALYKRGKGLYDVAVYDNNYPGRLRAFHIDVRKDTFEYLMFTVPGGEPMMAEGNMQLVPVEALLPENLPCAFCSDGEVNVSVAPIKTTARVSVTVTAPDGSRIKGLKVIKPTDTASLHGYRSFPTFVVPAGVQFRVSLSSPDADEELNASVTVATGPAHFLPMVTIRKDSTTSLTYKPRESKLNVTGTRGTDGIWRLADVIGSTEWIFAAAPIDVDSGERVTMAVDPKRYTATMTRTSSQGKLVTFVANATGAEGSITAQTPQLTWPSRGSVEFSYRDWVGPGLKHLKGALIAEDGERTPLDFSIPPPPT